MNSPIQILKLMRPHQWLKNGFVLVGPFFAHAWDEPGVVSAVLLAIIVKTTASSATPHRIRNTGWFANTTVN